jgi:uncharacterized membrane protein YeiH
VSNIESLGQHTLVALEYVGTAAFAVSGVVGAIRKRMDIVGICVCGFLAAFGGGTLRDVLIDRRPFFWVEHQEVLLGILLLCVACATFFKQNDLETSEKLLSIPDALGLGLFCTTGLHLSWSMGQPPAVAIMMGVITGTFGGVLRDMVCNEIPSLFRDHRPYAVCALLGAGVYILLAIFGLPEWMSVAACTLVTTGTRLVTLWLNLKLPSVDFGIPPKP